MAVPIHLIKDVVYVKIWECVGAPSSADNKDQFPALGLGCFAIDASTGKFYAHDGTSWREWSTVTIAL